VPNSLGSGSPHSELGAVLLGVELGRVRVPLPSAKREQLKTFQGLLRPETGLGCLMCARFARQRTCQVESIHSSALSLSMYVCRFPAKKNNINRFKNFRTENCASQGQNLVVAVLYVPCSLDSGPDSMQTGRGRRRSGHCPRHSGAVPSVKRTRHTQDSQGQIRALAFR